MKSKSDFAYPLHLYPISREIKFIIYYIFLYIVYYNSEIHCNLRIQMLALAFSFWWPTHRLLTWTRLIMAHPALTQTRLPIVKYGCSSKVFSVIKITIYYHIESEILNIIIDLCPCVFLLRHYFFLLFVTKSSYEHFKE